MILTYHPIYDAYHCAFRLLRILCHENIEKIEKDKLRILDFYLLFPDLIKNITMSREDGKWRNELLVSLPKNKYNIASVSRQVFEKLKYFHVITIDYLENKGLITIDTGDFIVLKKENIPADLKKELDRINGTEKNLMEFICGILCSYNLLGKQGLKYRTGLMESKYDAV